jgi:hypothetical protein
VIELTASIMLFVGGFWWGEWFAQRQADKMPKLSDAGTVLLTRMSNGLLDKRKFVGRSVEITAEHYFEIGENEFTLSLCLNADESADA